MVDIKLQNIVLSHDINFDQHWWMLYRGGGKFTYNQEERLYSIGPWFVEFFTYFNSFSISKWRTYTVIDNLKLLLHAYGNFKIDLFGHYRDDNGMIQKEILLSKTYNISNLTDIVLEYPKEDTCMMYSFQISSYSNFTIKHGYYFTSIDKEKIRDVNVTINITTFKREQYVKRNLKILRDFFANSDELSSSHFHVNVVDNGSTLQQSEIESEKISYYSNNNVGGAGGFARGMIETIRSNYNTTHCLLMDDDVKILPESLIRTFSLLSTIKEEYSDSFISGSMLMLDAMNIQHEDVGYVHKNGSYRPKKPIYELHLWENVFKNEEEMRSRKYEYAAWWYCCIPMKYITKDNLPLPLFIRGDDVEFSLRNSAKIITLGGICVWHQSFDKKYNQSLELYQVLRNSLIIQSTSSIFKEVDFIPRFNELFFGEINRLDYNGASLVLDALEDYMSGPDFLFLPQGE